MCKVACELGIDVQVGSRMGGQRTDGRETRARDLREAGILAGSGSDNCLGDVIVQNLYLGWW